ncbi:hypothetical protein PIIN_06185 [Serendipita indica DSM 11827]|uniref:Uncharacterized protein n=1 Tax=Serendipita indica (strain DSM 11827) TaxID=1109443 RepID=G4TLQ8_SERID|nr:hypothetical protein PIIN_06185 [Serendipita indica DSM 11827]
MEIESAVSRTLGIPELLDIIIGHVACRKWRAGEPTTDRVSLINLAQVNKYFSPIALSHLWRDIISPHPLAHILGLDSALIGDDQEKQITDITDRLERFVYYSKFIRFLHLYTNKDKPFESWDNLAVTLIAVLGQYPHLFEGVHTLGLAAEIARDNHQLLPFLLKPTLKKLWIMTEGADLTTIYTLVGQCIQLDDFEDLGNALQPGFVQELVVPTLQKLTRLQSVHLPVTLRAAFIILSNLSIFTSLHTLNLQIMSDLPGTDAGPFVNPTNGASLKKLIITTGIGELMLAAARYCAGNSIVVDEFEFARSPLAGESVALVMQTITETWPRLKKCRYRELDYGRSRSWCHPTLVSRLVVLPAYLQSVFRLASLQSLKLFPFSHVSIDTQFLNALAKACPLLHSCLISTDKRICAPDTEEPIWSLTMRDVVQFAIKMPFMRNLGIAFDGRKASDPNPDAMIEGSNEKMDELHVNVSAIDDADYATQMLSKAFPNLRLMWWIFNENIRLETPECLRLPEAERNIWGEVENRLGLEIIE